MKTISTVLALVLLASSSQAHVTVEQKEAEAGSVYKAVFKVGHGCDGSATRQISVTVPPGLRGAKPVPKAGWTLAVKPGEISWTANTEADFLQDAWYDEFMVRGSLQPEPGELWFKVRQVCVKGESNWAEIPAPGESTRGLKAPAARLIVNAKALGSAPGTAPAQAH